jgi:hypothetical protein
MIKHLARVFRKCQVPDMSPLAGIGSRMHTLSVDHWLSLRIFHFNLVTIQHYFFIAYVSGSTFRIHACTTISPFYTSSLSLRLLSNPLPAFTMHWKQSSVIGQSPCTHGSRIGPYMRRHAAGQFFHFTHVWIFYVSECGWRQVNASSLFECHLD